MYHVSQFTTISLSLIWIHSQRQVLYVTMSKTSTFHKCEEDISRGLPLTGFQIIVNPSAGRYYRAVFFWNQATSVHHDIPDFHNWGWQLDNLQSLVVFFGQKYWWQQQGMFPSYALCTVRNNTKVTASAAELRPRSQFWLVKIRNSFCVRVK